MDAERARSWAQDAGVTALLLLTGFMGTQPASANQVEWNREADVLAHVLVVLAALPFLLRHRNPVPVLVTSGAAVLTYLGIGYAFGPIMLTVPVACYTIGAALPHRNALRWVGGYYAVMFVVVVARVAVDAQEYLWRQTVGWGIVSLVAFAAPLAIGAAARVRRQSQADVREALAHRAVSEERLRMAQELHDSVGHGLAVVAMQAGVALHVLERNPGKAREALEAIRDTSRESLNGLRAELQVLRRPADEVAPRRPAVGLAEADVLLERIRDGGVDVEAAVDVDTASLPPEVDVAAYRVLQEALTNVLRHSGATHTRVRIMREPDEVVVEVVDNGNGGTPGAADTAAGSGSGIAGMRARAEALNGTLEAGSRAEGGFGVLARLPVRELSVPGSAP